MMMTSIYTRTFLCKITIDNVYLSIVIFRTLLAPAMGLSYLEYQTIGSLVT